MISHPVPQRRLVHTQPTSHRRTRIITRQRQRHRLAPKVLRILRRTPHPGPLPLASRQNQVSTEPGQLQPIRLAHRAAESVRVSSRRPASYGTRFAGPEPWPLRSPRSWRQTGRLWRPMAAVPATVGMADRGSGTAHVDSGRHRWIMAPSRICLGGRPSGRTSSMAPPARRWIPPYGDRK